jgi:hypothetical protein
MQVDPDHRLFGALSRRGANRGRQSQLCRTIEGIVVELAVNVLRATDRLWPVVCRQIAVGPHLPEPAARFTHLDSQPNDQDHQRLFAACSNRGQEAAR